MPRQITQGVWKGNMIRRARKAGPCQYGPIVTGGPHCKNRIEVGDEYFEGEGDMFSGGGWAVERYCMAHIGDDDPAKAEG